MKAKVTKNFKFKGKTFKEDEIYDVKSIPSRLPATDGVFINGKWFCDIGSPIFKENFVLI